MREVQPSSGLPALDKVLDGIRLGDNIVWQVDSIEDYLPIIEPLVAHAKANGEKLVYFRFAQHKELVAKNSGVEVYQLRPEDGVELFISKIHDIIKRTGKGAYYIFDSLSELALNCFSERMLGNFFKLTCPYLCTLEAVAYFAVLRNCHSYHAALPIAKTTQILLNLYRYKDKIYIHPLKVDQRHSPTMFMLHAWEKNDFIPITESTTISEVLRATPWPGLQSASYRMIGMWDRRFIQAEEILESHHRGECSKEAVEKIFHRQLRQLISHDERILTLAEKYLTLSDIIYIWKRLIGSGMIGGKAAGMVLARAILEKTNPRWAELLEPHDSFFIGSDIFYSFLVDNDCWSIRQNQKKAKTLLDGADEARYKILQGNFPHYVIARFSDMLDYFGQTPIIVRSSSFLEDNFNNSFSGKYESVFCTNQGTKEHRLKEFMDAIKTVYASTMSEKALLYRAKRNILEQDEQMALLVQRVSGKPYNNIFFPQLAGVAFSYNPYVWDPGIDPKAGMLRLVFGLGTRAVERHDDDYTHIIALNEPNKRPVAGFEEAARYSQKKVDMLDLAENRLISNYFIDVVHQCKELHVELFASIDQKQEQYSHPNKNGIRSYVITFDKLFSDTSFINNMQEMLGTLRNAYSRHVDIEFTTNFLNNGTYKINLVQCRPLQIEENVSITEPIPIVSKKNLIMEAHGGIVGQSRTLLIDRLIYVDPSVYGHLSQSDRYSVARLIGKLTHIKDQEKPINIMLLGPGRWGTSTPSLGVPVSFAEINTVSVIVEMDTMHEGLIPDLSLGTHFFNDLVEMNMLYIGLFSRKKENVINKEFLTESTNHLLYFVQEDSSWSSAIRVIEASHGQKMVLSADTINQKAVVYITEKPGID